ncbi:hybrid sensor histidine kinase/response regulator [Bacteroidales bacterium]|nr:hybrid sensor histidine kinase/response regulator [Bacteroidales bacterium]
MELTFLEGSMSEEIIDHMNPNNEKVLVVDDYPDNLIFIGELLSANNIEVFFADNGFDALEKASEIIPDLILLDVSMPKISGFDVCKKLKENPYLKHIPVIFITAMVETENIIEGFEAGGVDFIKKPFNLSELMSRIKIHLEIKNKHEKLQVMNSKLIQAVQKRSLELVKVNDHLSKLDNAKNDFLVHINHQLRTPLNGIMGYSELLARSDLDDQQTEFVSEINKLVKQLVCLSEKSLLYSELRSNKYNLQITNIEAQTSIEKAMLVVSGRYGKKSVYINNEIASDDFMLYADEHLLYRCVTILLDNAVKFSTNDCVVNISGEKKGGKTYIYIRDTGLGINSSIKKYLFEMFAGGAKTDEREYGFGLGLATAKLIMDIHSGEIKIENAEKKGTIATLIFEDKIN